ncbi:hypothetical protein LZ518_06815 [Sphingomonas sp. RB56-2]|uniref:MFS transporter n=1 Tax=Sphingomonas brevis TaxID=2908206 RepID=A0ABT0S8W8_9SPHN|nr:hypothetical protein [Sphingomonas brevis]MCL6740844.1 hypothetical protein [Sphingomonas brevis]
MTFEEMRLDFITRRNGSLALPITGIIAYSAAALLSLLVDPRWHNLVLTLCFWSIMPIGALMMKLRGEELGDPVANPLFGLAAKGRWMALATWSVHIMVWIYAPELFPVTIGICFALHWVIFSWTLNHPVGYIHLAMRIMFVIAAWHLVPSNRMGAVAAGIALAYAISVMMLSRIDWKARLAVA